MQKQENDIFKLAKIITRSFEQELSAQECQELEKWLAESDRHKEQYEQFKTIEFLKQKSQERTVIDWQKDCQVFLSRKKQKHISIRRILQYAAAAVFLLSIGTALWLYERPAVPEFIAEEISPIRKKAILTLAQGEQISLSDSTFTQLKDQSGTHINIQGSQVTYSNQGNDTTTTRYNTLRTPRGGEYMLTLADGTKVWLNAESTMRYPVEFVGDERIVYVEGEAYFDVKKDESKPFVVRSGQTDVKVMGTSFNFRSYPDENGVLTTLVSGAVIMASRESKQEIRLEPGEQGALDKESGCLSKRTVDTYLYSAWKDGRFVFLDTRLEDLFHVLARWYDLQVFYVHPGAKDIRFTGDLNKSEDFGTILKIIENNERVEFEVNERTVSVRLR